MLYMVEARLFEMSQGVITCLKLAESIDKSMTNSPKMRAWIGKQSVMTQPDAVNTCHELEVEVEKEVEKEKILKDLSQKNTLLDAFNYFWLNMKLKKSAKPKAIASFNKHAKKESDPMVFAEMLVSDTKQRSELNQFGFDKLNPTTYLNQKRWEDDKPVNIAIEYKYVLDAFNEAMQNTQAPQAESMTEKRVCAIKHLFAITNLTPETVKNYFNHVATAEAFAWERGETGNQPVDLSYYLTEQAYNKARER